MANANSSAPGGPGIPARWTSSAKSGVGTALNPHSRVWFTLSHGIFNEIYYPRVDRACVARDAHGRYWLRHALGRFADRRIARRYRDPFRGFRTVNKIQDRGRIFRHGCS